MGKNKKEKKGKGICVLFQILFHYILLQDIEYSSVCYIVGPCCLPVLYTVVCIYVNPKLLIYLSPQCRLSPLVTIGLFSMSVSLFLFRK